MLPGGEYVVEEREEEGGEGEGEEGSSIISGPSMGGRARSVCLGMVGGGAEDTCCVGEHVLYNVMYIIICERVFSSPF